MIIFKGPVVSELTFNSCLVEWQPAKLNSINSSVENIESSNADLLEYCLQLQSVKKESDYKEIYKGDSCSFRLKNLEPGIEYNVRVCAVRVFNSDSNSNRLCSSFTSHTSFITLKVSSRLNQHKKMLETSSDVAKSASVSSFSRFSRLLLPSFYLNLNTSKSSKQQTVLTFSQNNNQKMQANIGKKTLVQKSTNRKTSDPAILNNASLLQENISSRQITDQQWAFLFIIILVIIAFLIAYAVNSFLASYYDLTSEL